MKQKLLLLSLLLPFFQLWAQSPPLEHIGVEKGLLQGFVTFMTQDRDGFIWMGSTYSGLQRFDGHRFKIYQNKPFDSLSLSSNNVVGLVDLGDFFLVSTSANGLNIMHKKSERFFRLPFSGIKEQLPFPKDHNESVLLEKLPTPGVNLVWQDGEGIIWVKSAYYTDGGEWLCRMIVPDMFWEKLAVAAGKEKDLLLSKIRFQCFKTWKSVGLTQDMKTMYQYDEKEMMLWQGGLWKELPLPPAPKESGIGTIWQQPPLPGDYWHTVNGEIWHATVPGNQWTKLMTAPEGRRTYWFIDNLAWTFKGLMVEAFPFKSDPFHIDFSSPLVSVNAKDPKLLYMFDFSGNFWFSPGIEGAYKLSPRVGRFHHQATGYRFLKPLKALPGGMLYAYTEEGGVYFSGPQSPLLTLLQAEFERVKKRCRIVHPDRKGRIWLGGFNTLWWVDTATRELHYVRFPFETAHAANEFFIDENDIVWAAIGGYLIQFDTKGKTSAAYDYRSLGMEKLTVNAISRTANGAVWLATEDGLLEIIPKQERLIRQEKLTGSLPGTDLKVYPADAKIHRSNPADRNSLTGNYIACLLPDPGDPGILWIGTKGYGLNRLDTRTGRFFHLTRENGLPDNVVYGILPDNTPPVPGSTWCGDFWLSTNKGLVRYNPSTGSIKNFRKEDGLQDDEFNTGSFAKGPDGKLYFGGINGMNIFDPKDITGNPHRPKVFITGLKINNVPVAVGDSSGILSTAIEFAERITLPYSKNSIMLEFAALEFTDPTKNRFRYYLEGAETEWANESLEPYATYLNLAPGSYTFVLDGSNNDGLWSGQPVRLEIRILPPWYRHPFAYLSYFLILAGICYRYWKQREDKRKLEHRLELEQLEFEQRLEMERQQATHLQEMNRLKLDELTGHLLEKSRLIEALEKKHKQGSGTYGTGENHHHEQLGDARILTKNDWEDFQHRFEQVYPGFIAHLTQRIPNLTPAETRLILLMKMGRNSTESASMLGISPDTIKKTRHRLRKKLEAQGNVLENLFEEEG